MPAAERPGAVPRGARPTARDRSRGTSLVEVLVAVVVSAIGLMGLVALQTGALRSAKTAVVAGAANAAVDELADRMRSNMLAHATANGYARVARYETLAGTKPDRTDCAVPSCTVDEVIREDLADWQRSLATRLPDAAGIVLRDAPTVYRVVVAWRERAATVDAPPANGACPAEVAAPEAVRCVVVTVRP